MYAATLTVGTSPVSVVAADVNGDGTMDLISADQGDSTLTVLINNGSGGFVYAATLPVETSPVSVVAADVNGDGYKDLICGSSGNALTVLTNDGSGNFVLASSPTANLGVGGRLFAITAADVNGDGKVDLICAGKVGNILKGSDARLSVLLNAATFNGNGSELTGLNASQVTTGTVPTAALAGTYSGVLTLNNAANNFTGNGGGLTGLNASQVSGVAVLAGGNTFTGNQTVAGNVGIGTTTPNYPLDFGQSLGDKLVLWDDGNGQSYGFGIQGAQLQVHADNTASDIVFGTGSSTNLTESMRIKGSGNVGIGTNNPASKLHVVGDGAAVQLQAVTAGNSCYQAFWNSARTVECLIGADGNGFSGAPNQFSIGTWTSHPMGFFTGANQRMKIDTTGNIGIGTTSPQKLLQVGDSTVTGSQGMIHLASRTFDTLGIAQRDWDIGVPQTGDSGVGIGYSFIIHDSGMAYPSQLLVQYLTGNVGIANTNPAHLVCCFYLLCLA